MQEKANSLNSNRTSTKIHDIGDIELKKKKFRRNRSVLIKVDLLEETTTSIQINNNRTPHLK